MDWKLLLISAVMLVAGGLLSAGAGMSMVAGAVVPDGFAKTFGHEQSNTSLHFKGGSRAAVFLETTASLDGLFVSGRLDQVIATSSGTVLTQTGHAFSNNTAMAQVRAFDRVWTDCMGRSCSFEQSSFNDTYFFNVQPGTSSAVSGNPNVFEISLTSDVSTNSNMTSSYADAYADPTISIDPVYALAHPEISLSFSANIGQPMPEPGTWAMLLLGLAPILRRASRRVTG